MKHTIKTEKFEGPIAVLYQMIEDRKISVSEFSLVQITEDFIDYVKKLEGLDKEETTHFISIASILILLKSKTLIPELVVTEEEDRDIQILENQLAAFALLKERVKILRDLWGRKILQNAKVNYLNTSKIFVPDPSMNGIYFHNYISLRLSEIIPKEDEKKEVKVYKTLKIEDALSHVRTIISRIKSLNFNNFSGHEGDVRLREKNKRNIVILFLAVLELVKIGEIDVTQESNFSDILVTEN